MADQKIRKGIHWGYLILGILDLLLGFYFIFNFGASFVAISLFVSFYFFIAGVGGMFVAIAGRKEIPNFGLFLVVRIIDLIIGIMVLVNPGISAMFLIFMCGFGFLMDAILTMATAFQAKRAGGSWIPLLILGIVAILAAFFVIAHPLVSVFMIAISVAISVISLGFSMLAAAFEYRN